MDCFCFCVCALVFPLLVELNPPPIFSSPPDFDCVMLFSLPHTPFSSLTYHSHLPSFLSFSLILTFCAVRASLRPRSAPQPPGFLRCYPSSSIGPFITSPGCYRFIRQAARSPTAADNNQHTGHWNVQTQGSISNVARHLKLCRKFSGKFSLRQDSFEGHCYKVLNSQMKCDCAYDAG